MAAAAYSTGMANIEVHIPWSSAGSRAIRALVPVRRLIAGPPARRVGPDCLERIEGAGKIVLH